MGMYVGLAPLTDEQLAHVRALGIDPERYIMARDHIQRVARWTGTAWGKTARLVCRRCGDLPPEDATFCIMCGQEL